MGLVYVRVGGFGFVNLDDPLYVTENPRVLGGLGWDGVEWAFTSFHASNWHPLTWLSHMADVELLGVDPGRHHLVNVVLHALNTLAVFGLLRAATGAVVPSALVAALFGVHPLHVESVAWISERKDVLSTLFLLLALRSWVAYARSPGPAAYLAALVLFALGLLAKPMLVSMPLLLLLVDAWPLGRLALPPRRGEPLRRLALEVAPFAALSLASCVLTWLAQSRSTGGAHGAISSVPLGARVANAVVSYAAYLGKAIWPADLAAFYPHPYTAGGTSPVRVVLAAGVLAALSAIAVRTRARRPYVAWGWLWYLASLLPVIGLVQVGAQAMADRYTYVPLLGPLVAVVWAGASLAERGPAWRRWLAAGGAAAVVASGVVAWRQAGFWRDSATLQEHAIEVTEGNWKAWASLGSARLDQGRSADAIRALDESLRLLPTNALAWNELGIAYLREARTDEAIAAFREAIRQDAALADAWYDLGLAEAGRGRLGEGIDAFRQAVRLREDHADAWHNLGALLLRRGEGREAAACFRQATRLRPGDPQGWAMLTVADLMAGNLEGALGSLERLRPLDPDAARQLEERMGAARR